MTEISFFGLNLARLLFGIFRSLSDRCGGPPAPSYSRQDRADGQTRTQSRRRSRDQDRAPNEIADTHDRLQAAGCRLGVARRMFRQLLTCNPQLTTFQE